jgi:hypothetical protein
MSMIRELTDGFQDGIVKGHLTGKICLNDGHADDLGRADNTVTLVRWVTRLAALLSVKIN